jgi:hypothetical protein
MVGEGLALKGAEVLLSEAPAIASEGWPAVAALGRSALQASEEFVQKIFVGTAEQAKIPLSAGEELGRPASRIVDMQLPKGQFTPNETEWRQIKFSPELQRAYGTKFRRGESPSLNQIAPPRVQALNALKAGAPSRELPWMTSRGLDTYIDKFDPPMGELNAAGKVWLDLGPGGQQEAAKDARLLGFRSIIASVDQRLALPLAEDLHGLSPTLGRFRPGAASWGLTPEEYRYLGRLHPEPFTAAHESELPFKDYDGVMGLYSASHYGDMTTALNRVNRLLKPNGFGGLYPIRPQAIESVNSWFKNANMQHVLELKPEPPIIGPSGRFLDPEASEYHLLTWRR